MPPLNQLISEAAERSTPWLKSFGSELEKFPAGKLLKEHLENVFEPQLHKIAQQRMDALGAKATPQDINNAFRDTAEHLRVRHFGPKQQLLTAVIKDAYNKGGPILANNVSDGLNIYFHENKGIVGYQLAAQKAGVPVSGTSAKTPINQVEAKIRSGFSWLITPRIVIPHMTQPLNFLMFDSVTSVAKGLAEYFTDYKSAKAFVKRSGALADEYKYQLMSQSTGGNTWIARLFHQPGFNFVRRQQIIWSALAGKHSALESAEELLSNPNSKRAITNLKSLGLDPQKIAQKGGLSAEDIELAAYRNAQETMFIRSGLDTPHAWETNMATRLTFMYKHFAYNEGRFLIEAFRKAYAAEGIPGVAKTAAIIATLFPVAGEFVKLTEQLITGRDDNPKDNFLGNEYTDAIAHASGFGIMYGMVRSAQRSATASYFAGPFFGLIDDLSQDLWRGDLYALGRDTTRRAGVFGPAISNTMFPRRKSKKNP